MRNSRFLKALWAGKGPQDPLKAYLYRIAHNWVPDVYRHEPPPSFKLTEEFSADSLKHSRIILSPFTSSSNLTAIIISSQQDNLSIIQQKGVKKMNKNVLSVVVVVVLAAALGTAGFVYAQTSIPQAPVPGTGYGQGMMTGGQGMRGGMMGQGQTTAPRYGMGVNGVDTGILHDGMIAVYAEKLGLTVAEIDTHLANGETMAQIASSTGLTADQFQALILVARSQAIDQAVKAGTLTQAQADSMKQRGAGMMAGGRGMRGGGQGQYTNPDCPYYQTNP